MSRPIKFRAWVQDYKGKGNPSMVYADDTYDWAVSFYGKLVEPYHKDFDFDEETGISETDLGYELMQFTGLTDKNGKEIYEGDIVQDGADRVAVVKYEPAEFTADYLNQNDDGVLSLDLLAPPMTAEVIGNIHENKELLK